MWLVIVCISSFVVGLASFKFSLSKRVFPDAYSHNLRKERGKRLANPRVWVGVLVIVIASYLAVSHGLWWRLTSRLEEVNSQIVDVEKRLDTATTTKR